MSRSAASHGNVALLLVDLQNAYFESPALDEVKDELIERANVLIDAARAAQRPVVLVRTVHERDRSTWTINMLEDDEGFAFPGTAQASYVDGLDTDGGSDVTKIRDDAFHGTRLLSELAQLQVNHLLIGGVSTHSCVAATAAAAFAHDLHVSIAGAAIASEKPALSEAMLEFLSVELRQPVLDQAASLALLHATPAGGR